MERHRCKLCSRSFANGRALGGHMKAHLATLPLPLPPKPQPPPPLSDDSASFSSSSYSSSESEAGEQNEETLLAAVEQRETEEKFVIANYGLRENPKKSFRVADPEFSFPATDTGVSVVVQDRESETESKNPTRRRSKRTRKSIVMSHVHTMEQQPNNNKKKPKLSFMESPECAEPVSSVSNTSPEEDVAMCLMMLSRDRWNRKSVAVVKEEEEQEIKLMKKRVRGKHECENCGKTFRSSGALGSHKSICFINEVDANDKVFECPFCSKVFGSGQALGGHKRSHLIPSSTSNAAANGSHSARLNPKENLFIDLNLPAPPEEDDLSVVSYA